MGLYRGFAGTPTPLIRPADHPVTFTPRGWAALRGFQLPVRLNGSRLLIVPCLAGIPCRGQGSAAYGREGCASRSLEILFVDLARHLGGLRAHPGVQEPRSDLGLGLFPQTLVHYLCVLLDPASP